MAQRPCSFSLTEVLEDLVEFEVKGEVIEWRGPSPFYFLPMTKDQSDEIETYKLQLSYGWGVVPAEVKLGEVTTTTSLIPRNGIFLVPLKDLLRKSSGLQVGSRVAMLVRLRG